MRTGGSLAGQPGSALRLPDTKATLWQYTHGVPDVAAVSPDGYSLDDFYLARPGADEISSTCSATTQATSRALSGLPGLLPQTPAAGAGGLGPERPLLPAGRRGGIQRDIPEADVRFFETGHFVLETHAEPIAAAIRDFFRRESTGLDARRGPTRACFSYHDRRFRMRAIVIEKLTVSFTKISPNRSHSWTRRYPDYYVRGQSRRNGHASG